LWINPRAEQDDPSPRTTDQKPWTTNQENSAIARGTG
jgi:hypothetical protein